MKRYLSVLLVMGFIYGLVSFTIWIETWKYHAFLEITHSDISFWKWYFLFHK